MNSPKFRITFKDRIGFIYDISRVIIARNLNIVSIEIKTGSLYIHLQKINHEELGDLLADIKNVEGVSNISSVAMMPSEEREKKIKAVLDTVSEGILALDVEGNITNINPVAEQIFQSSSVEILGKNIAEILSPEVPILQCLKTGKSYNNKEISINTSRGRLNFISTARTLKDDKGNITGAVACIKDMSEVKQLVYSVTKPYMTTFDEIIGISASIKNAMNFAKMVAKGDSTVLIRGESGTGKELFARAIHMESLRHNKPFVPINCAALPENLLESELFGYVEGAFTGAQKGGKLGLIEFANNGTLFLDEIGELSTHLQAKLLRVLQEGCVRRIGDRTENVVNIRVIAATNRNLEDMIRKGSFREDLYYRLNVLPINIPPLRQRKEDIPVFIEYFFLKYKRRLNKEINGIAENALKKLLNYNWPGNIRELENVLERAMILVENAEIQPQNIMLDSEYNKIAHNNMQQEDGDYGIDIIAENITLDEAVNNFEKQFLAYALKKYHTIRKTAKALGVSHTTIMNKIKKLGL